jgi:hypothetical protein
VLLLLTASALGPTAVRAEPATPVSASDTAAAKQHFERGRSLFDAGAFLDALHEFEAGYRLAPFPLFLYNMGQACRHARLIDRAIESYERYLQAVPDAPERAEVEQYLRDLRAAQPPVPVVPPPALVAQVDSGAPPLIATAPRTPHTESHGHRWLWYGGLLVAVAAGSVTAIVLSSGHDAPHTDLGNLQVHAP